MDFAGQVFDADPSRVAQVDRLAGSIAEAYPELVQQVASPILDSMTVEEKRDYLETTA